MLPHGLLFPLAARVLLCALSSLYEVYGKYKKVTYKNIDYFWIISSLVSEQFRGVSVHIITVC